MKTLSILLVILVLAVTACDVVEQLPTMLPATFEPTVLVTSLPPPPTPPLATPTFTPGETAVVTRIIDGDTIDVDIEGEVFRVRYIGMDTPERGMPFFDEATEANRLLVEGQTLVLVKDVSETDRYGRLLRYVYLLDGTFVNAELVAQGYAQAATFPPDVAFAELFLLLQEEARETGRGLWAE